jgi:hypothetical protein
MSPSSATLIGQSWSFWQKQPTLQPVLFWLLFAPALSYSVCIRLLLGDGESMTAIDWSSGRTIVLILGMAAAGVTFVWGGAAVLVVGKRILGNKAGRSRSSFRSVRNQAARSLVPLLLTGLLRDCFTILWSLLLIIPGIVYALRTTFHNVIVVCEGIAYREALERSKEAMDGHLIRNTLCILALAIQLFVPVIFIEQAAIALVPQTDLVPSYLLLIFTSGLRSIATLLMLLSLVHLYAFLLATKKHFEEVTPDELDEPLEDED